MIAGLRALLRGEVRTDEATLVAYGRDASLARSRPLAVARPKDTDDVVALVGWARRHGVGLTPRGSGTGLSGGSVGDGVIVDMAGWRTVEARPDDLVARVGPGVVNMHLQERLAGSGLFWPPDPSSHRVATIGGNLATNAGGPACLKHGVTRHWVLGLQAVLGTGELAEMGSLAMKDVAGYDLVGLMVGSEGTLGIITRADLRLLPLPKARGTMLATYDDLAAAAEAVLAIRATGVVPEALEFMDSATLACVEESFGLGLTGALLLAECTGHPEAVRAELATVTAAATPGSTWLESTVDPAQRQRLWAARRGAFGSLAHRGRRLLVEDVSVPISRLVEMVETVAATAARHGLTIMTMGHAGDGNLHPQFILDGGPGEEERTARAVDDIVDAAVALGGTLTGEHGVGTLKAGLLARVGDPAALTAMRAIKAALDPDGIMNPGKVLAT
ncbi:FAD-binding protein [bacterium]|nr:FAD-binding protein [bacterium]